MQKVPFTTSSQWNWVDLSTPYFDSDTFFVAFHFDGSTYLNHDFGPPNGRGYSSSNGITWSPTGLGNNALIRAIIRYETPSKDAAVKSVDYPGHLFRPDSVVTPVATVKNTGQDTISFDILCTVDTSGVGVYSSTKSIADLAPDSTYHVTFDNWLPIGSGYPCLLKVVTQHALDSLSANDTLELTTTPYTPLTTIPSGWALSPPTIDGTIDPSEWQNAFCVDVSDLDGCYAGPEPARTIYLYVMNDSSALYLAVDYPSIFYEESNSRFLFYFDDDNNGIWASDSSEGYYKLANNDVYWDIFYALPTSWWVNVSSELIDAEVNVTYHLTYEVSIPFHETTQWLLNTAPGDTIGFHCFMHSQDARSNYRWPMWWPTLMDSSYHEEPGYYGDIALAPESIPGIESFPSVINIRRDALMLTCTPNPFTGNTLIKYHLPETIPVNLTVYDITGRLITTILHKKQKHGCHKIVWDGTNELGKEVSSGVYLLTLDAGEYKEIRKLLLIR